jgi:hypothetical protein
VSLIANAVGRLPVPVTVRILLAVFLTLATGVLFYSHNWFLINAAAGGVTPGSPPRRLAGAHRLRGRPGHHATALPRRRRRHCPRPAEQRLVRRGSGAAEDRRDAGRPDPADTEIGPRLDSRVDETLDGQVSTLQQGLQQAGLITRLAPRRFSQRPSVDRYTEAHPALARLADDVGGLTHLAERAADGDALWCALAPPAAQLGAALDRLAEDVDDPARRDALARCAQQISQLPIPSGTASARSRRPGDRAARRRTGLAGSRPRAATRPAR